MLKVKDLSTLRNIDRNALIKEKCILEEEKCALRSENDTYFGTKFKYYKVKVFWGEGSV